MVDVAALYHEVVQTPVCVQHQVVQDDESKRTSDGWNGTSHENDTLFKFLPEAILERRGPIKRPVTQTFTDIEQAMLVFMLFVVEVIVVSRPTAANTEDVQEPLGFRLVPVRIVSISFGDGAPREGVLS